MTDHDRAAFRAGCQLIILIGGACFVCGLVSLIFAAAYRLFVGW